VEAFYKAGDGAPLVLLHGFTNTWRAWRPVLPALEAQRSVLAPTLPGHHGGLPFAPGAPVSIAAMADAIERLMDAEGIERAHLAGSSLGGWLSLELGRRGRALSVVGVCPAGGWEVGTPEERSVVRYFRRATTAARLIRPWWRTIARRPRLRAIAFRDMHAHPARIGAAAALAGLEATAKCTIVAEMIALANAGELFDELGPIECPVRVVQATGDRLFKRPGHYAKLRRLLPEAEWVTVEGLGHLPMSDDPAQVAELILSCSGGEPLPDPRGRAEAG
jgi:pimeloyl-ACP methyl ester carboxylesterase